MRRAVRAGEQPYLLVLPVFLVVALFTLYPLVYALTLSARQYLLTQPFNTPFVGLRNYLEVVTSEYFRGAILNTLRFALAAVPLVLAYGLGVALLLNSKAWPRAARVLGVIVLLPWAIPPVVSGIMWKWVFHSDYGVLNGLLQAAGLMEHYFPWLSTPATAFWVVTLAHVWKEGSLATILFLAGLQTIPEELQDAVRIDGGGFGAYVRSVVLPFLKPTALILLIYETMVAFTVFDLVYVMTGGGPANATSLVAWFAYTETFRFLNLGRGAALSVLIAVGLVGFILVYLRLLKTEELY